MIVTRVYRASQPQPMSVGCYGFTHGGQMLEVWSFLIMVALPCVLPLVVIWILWEETR